MTCALALSLIAKPLRKHTFLAPLLNGDPFTEDEMLSPSGRYMRLLEIVSMAIHCVVFPWLKQLLEFECLRIRIVMVNVVKRPEPAGIKRATSIWFVFFPLY